MPNNTWKLTAAGVAALVDGDNRATRAVAIRTIAIGSGHGEARAGEIEQVTALRSQRDSAAVGGQSGVGGRIALRASIQPTADYDVTEVGVMAQVGSDPPFLLAYWTDSGRVLVPANRDSTTIIAGVIDLAPAAAEVMVTVSPTVSLSGVGAAVDLSDVPDAFVAGHYLRATSPSPTALENVSSAAVLSDLLGALASGSYPRVKLAGGVRSLEARTAAELTADMKLGTASAKDTGTTAGTVPLLGAGGKLSGDVLPKLGTAAAKDTGTTEGKVPLLGAGGKLAGDVLPKLGTAAAKDTGTTEGKVPLLGAGGKLSGDVLPKLGTAAAKDTGTTEGKVPLLGAGGKLAGDVLPKLGTAAAKDTGTTEGKVPLLGAGGKLAGDVLPFDIRPTQDVRGSQRLWGRDGQYSFSAVAILAPGRAKIRAEGTISGNATISHFRLDSPPSAPTVMAEPGTGGKARAPFDVTSSTLPLGLYMVIVSAATTATIARLRAVA